MKVLIDCRCLQSPPPRGGVGVLAEGMIHALIEATSRQPQAPSRIEFILFANGLVDPRKHLPIFNAPPMPGGLGQTNVQWAIGRWPNKVFNAACGLGLAAWGFDADIVFLPNLNFIPPLPKRTKLVVTVHDLSFEHFPDCFTVKQRLWHYFVRPQKLLDRADEIIAVSETTKRDVVETYGVPEEKVHVVSPGLPPSSFRGAGSDEKSHTMASLSPQVRSLAESIPLAREALPSGLEMMEKFVLTISELSPRKNIDGLIAAFELLTPHASRLTPPLHLVIAGIPGSATRALKRQIARSPARDRIHLIGAVTDNEKRTLLARAACFAYVSFWEGVGFPALEAMREGCPVVASTGGSLPEILGDAALLVDPLDPAAIAEAIERVLTDETLRTGLVTRGRAQAAQFTWTDAAQKVAHLFMR